MVVPVERRGETVSFTVTCPCGASFVLARAAFPCSVACHTCGSRTGLNDVAVTRTPDGWRVGEVEPPPHPVGPGAWSGAVACSLCDSRAFAACSRCGRFYCSLHGRERYNGGSTCVRCYERQRPGLLVGGVILAVAGL